MNPFFSIIIPIYNGLTHGLPKCLESIWSQPLDQSLYEVICIDDCSNDGTRNWLHEHKKRHDNLRIIENEKNMRQGGARNKGFRAAQGEYIALIDQDDYYHHDVFKTIYEHLYQSDLEILIVDCAYQTPGRESNQLQHNFPHLEVMNGDEMIERNSIPYAPWKFIFLRDFVIDKNLFFEENERIEDVDWVHLLVHHAKRVQYQPILFIHYNKSDISTTMTTYKSVETVYSTLRLGKRLEDMVETVFANSSEKVKSYIGSLSQKFFHLGLRNYFFMYDSINEKRRNIHNALDNCGSSGSYLIRFAHTSPTLYSVFTNCCFPLGRVAIWIYRKIKYL